MYVLFRVVSLILIILGLILLGVDLIASLEIHHIVLHSLDQIFTALNRPAMDGFKNWAQHRLPGPLPHWIFSTLALPSWSVPGVIGVILAFLFGRKLGPA